MLKEGKGIKEEEEGIQLMKNLVMNSMIYLMIIIIIGMKSMKNFGILED